MRFFKRVNNWFQNLDFRDKFAVIIWEMSFFLVIIGLLALFVIYKENNRIKIQYENRLLAIKWLTSTRANIRDNEATLYKILLFPANYKKTDIIAEIEKREKKTQADLHNYVLVAKHDAYEELYLPRLQQDIFDYQSIRNDSLKYVLRGDISNFWANYKKNLSYLERITDTLEYLSNYNDEQAAKEYKTSSRLAVYSYFILITSILVALFSAISLGFLVVKSLDKSIKRLLRNMEEVAAGNLDVEPIEVKYDDEIGRLSKSFNTMANNLRKTNLKEKISRDREDFLRQEIEDQRVTFLSTLTHDLRSPLISEQKALEVILSKKLGERLEDFAEYLEEMYRTNDALLRIVSNILISNYYEEGRIHIEFDFSKIEDVLYNAVKTLKPLIEENESSIKFDIKPDLPLVKMNSDEIGRVVVNLINNALSHNNKGITITISAEVSDGNVKVGIKDNGYGIPESEKDNIFQKYPTVKRKIGSGLGLYLSKLIIDSHNGKIWFDSKEGEGTAFYFLLPIE